MTGWAWFLAFMGSLLVQSALLFDFEPLWGSAVWTLCCFLAELLHGKVEA